MSDIPEEQKTKIIAALQEAGAVNPCPRCGNQTFSLVGGYFNQFIQNQLGGIVIGGPSIPSIAVVCNRCGFMAQHALGALKLLPPQSSPEAPTSTGEGEKK